MSAPVSNPADISFASVYRSNGMQEFYAPFQYSGGVVINNNLYLIPGAADHVKQLQFNDDLSMSAQDVDTPLEVAVVAFKWFGGATDTANNVAYNCPQTASSILIIRQDSDGSTIATTQKIDSNQYGIWKEGVLYDGVFYCSPMKGPILRFDTGIKEITFIAPNVYNGMSSYQASTPLMPTIYGQISVTSAPGTDVRGDPAVMIALGGDRTVIVDTSVLATVVGCANGAEVFAARETLKPPVPFTDSVDGQRQCMNSCLTEPYWFVANAQLPSDSSSGTYCFCLKNAYGLSVCDSSLHTQVNVFRNPLNARYRAYFVHSGSLLGNIKMDFPTLPNPPLILEQQVEQFAVALNATEHPRRLIAFLTAQYQFNTLESQLRKRVIHDFMMNTIILRRNMTDKFNLLTTEYMEEVNWQVSQAQWNSVQDRLLGMVAIKADAMKRFIRTKESYLNFRNTEAHRAYAEALVCQNFSNLYLWTNWNDTDLEASAMTRSVMESLAALGALGGQVNIRTMDTNQMGKDDVATMAAALSAETKGQMWMQENNNLTRDFYYEAKRSQQLVFEAQLTMLKTNAWANPGQNIELIKDIIESHNGTSSTNTR